MHAEGDPAPPGERAAPFPWRLLAPVLLVFVLLRAVASVQMGGSVYGRELLHDALEYQRLAGEFAAGHWQQPDAFFLGPGWPALLGVWFKLTGVGIGAARALNVLLSLGTLLLVARCAWRLAGPRAGIAAAALWALYEPALFHEQTVLMEVSAGFFSLACACAALEAFARPPGERRGRAWLLHAAACGALLGISALFRANSLLLAPVLLAALAVDGRRRADLRGAVLSSGVAILACLAAFVPTALHNWRAERAFIPIASNFGLNFFIGFSERSTGAYFIPPSADSEARGLPAARVALGRDDLSSSEISRHWSAQAWDFIRANPGRAAGLVLRRLGLVTNAVEFPQIYYPERMHTELPFLALPLPGYGFVFPLAMAGCAGLIASRRGAAWLWVAMLAALVASLLPFFITGRYRLPLAPFMIVAACAGIARAVESRAWRPTAVTGGLAVLACWPAWPWARMPETARWRFDEIRSALYLRAGDTSKAEEILLAIPEDMAGPTALNRLAKIAEESRRDFCTAADLYRRACEERPYVPQYWFNAGQARLRCLGALPPGPARESSMREARTCFERALQLDPGLPVNAWINLAGLRHATGDAAGARELLRTYVERNPGDELARRKLAELGG